MPEPYRGSIPNDRLYDTCYDMWVVLQADGRVLIGATGFGIHLAGEIIMFTGKPKGAEVRRGKGLGTVETGKTIIAVHSPVSVRDLQCNEAAETDPIAINRDPYGQGWLAVGMPIDWPSEQQLLVDASDYVEHVVAIDPAAVIERTAP